ncbi:MAG TPA: hypothetical protein VFM25_03855 [Verrucomicrobiae bacterium]|nr:hypothetical protein [Verrucomicrobiae bacterium]
MTQTENGATPAASVEEIQKGWNDLTLRVSQLEAERTALEQENKSLRFMLERAVEYRQKSHNELVLLLTGLVSKLPINDIGVIVSKLVEHNSAVSETCAALIKGKADSALPQPMILKALEQTKRDLTAALKPEVEELIKLDTPLENELLESLVGQPDIFFTPAFVRASRCFMKGQVPRERIVRQFGEESLVLFNDMTTDPNRNPRPRPEEIVLTFKPDFETLLQQNSSLPADKRAGLAALYQKLQRSKAATDEARLQRNVFQRLSFLIELLHYYENQNTESPEVTFAQRLPVLIEQLVVGGTEQLDEKLIEQAETLLGFIVHNDHRLMVLYNIGKGGGIGKTLKYVMLLRTEEIPDLNQVITDFIKRLIPQQNAPSPDSLASFVRLVHPDIQPRVVRVIMSTDRLRKEEAEALGKAVAEKLGIKELEIAKAEPSVPPETERQLAWEKIKDMISSRADPGSVAAAVRARLHAKYDADEIRQSWITLTEADPISLIRVFCQLPYLTDGSTDSVARAVMETYVTRLMHEKYASTYQKVMNSLRTMFQANASSPTLLNFMALVRWVDPAAANKLSADIGMVPAPA